MISRFEIVGHDSVRPGAERIIFCDGTGGEIFRHETDLELSHWRPNKTLQQYRAGTSTEICFRFLDDPQPGHWTAAVNNHVDVDGILSVYVLVHSQHALAHRQVITEAAEMGDFWGWGDQAAQRVFQGVTSIMASGKGKEVYTEAFRRIPLLIDGTDPNIHEINANLAPLRRGVELVEQDTIHRSLINSRLAHYVIPIAVAGDDDGRVAHSPEFNEAISENSLLWPHVRARWDSERVCLVSVERKAGWFHDLWFPGYLWADTECRWQVPGLTYHDGMGSYELDNRRLIGAFETLQELETAAGRWGLGGTQLPLGRDLQDRFPLAGRFLLENLRPATSSLKPEVVGKVLEGVLD